MTGRKRRRDSGRTVAQVTFHRNGVSGEPWYGVTFFDPASAREVALEPDTLFLAVVPADDEPGKCGPRGVPVYVVALDAPEERWRGDHYAEFVADAIRDWNAAEDARFARIAAEDVENAKRAASARKE